MGAVIWLIDTVANVVFWVIVIQFVLSVLMQLKILDMSSPGLQNIYFSLSRLIDPLLAPIRRILPDTGMIDFSPVVLMIALGFIKALLIEFFQSF